MPRYFYNQCRTWRTTVPYSQGTSQIYKLTRFVALQELLMHSVKWWQFGCMAPAESVALLIKLAKKKWTLIAGALHWSINPSRVFDILSNIWGVSNGQVAQLPDTFRIHVLVPSESTIEALLVSLCGKHGLRPQHVWNFSFSGHCE